MFYYLFLYPKNILLDYSNFKLFSYKNTQKYIIFMLIQIFALCIDKNQLKTEMLIMKNCINKDYFDIDVLIVILVNRI